MALRTPITLEEKYKVAINALQAISQRKLDKDEDLELGCVEAFNDCRWVAQTTLKRLGESLIMNNKRNI